MKIRLDQLLADWRDRLAAAGIECADAEAEILYCELTGRRRAELAMLRPTGADPVAAARGEAIVTRREKREPLQYLLGNAPFRDIELEVTPDVLIPRPETELLVDFVLKHLPIGGRLLDVGTGSGAIALAAAFERPDITVLALDVSPAALAVAERNAARLKLADRVEFRASNLLAALAPGETFDLVAANLPYIAEEDYAGLQLEVRDHEPKLALTAADGGLALVLELARQAPPRLKPGGRIIFEIGEGQAERLVKTLKQSYREVGVIRDYNRIDRHVYALK